MTQSGLKRGFEEGRLKDKFAFFFEAIFLL